MASIKSLDEGNLIATLLHDVNSAHVDVFSHAALDQTTRVVKARAGNEGTSFLTKTLPKLGKLLDKALVTGTLSDYRDLRFGARPGSAIPVFLGELFERVFDSSGGILPSPCAQSVRALRQLTYMFYKYELPYTADEELEVINAFERTEDDLTTSDPNLVEIQGEIRELMTTGYCPDNRTMVGIARRAQRLLERVFEGFDPLDIVPCHGPGSVATRQQLWSKYQWTNVSDRITTYYPFDAYFCASLGAVCDGYKDGFTVSNKSLPARVLLVPKDSRGPRLISCEPVDFQWVQGGLRQAIVDRVESHPLTKGKVNFTDQGLNREAARKGSIDGSIATLDLKEASDRVSLELVRLLFPEPLVRYLECCRSLSTVLPSGKELVLKKFAPMGSSLCFAIMALTIWALLVAAAPDEDTRKGILVYGDDVAVPTGYARDAVEVLEAFGLRVNGDKCCISGLFRESCGLDAYLGVDVTPVKLKTVWSSSRSPDSYCSWIDYANSFYKRNYYCLYNHIVERLHSVYGAIPSKDMNLSCPSLASVEQEWLPRKSRTNFAACRNDFQCKQWKVWDIKAPRITYELPGWQMLLRYFTEGRAAKSGDPVRLPPVSRYIEERPFSVRSYTRRGTSVLVRRWR